MLDIEKKCNSLDTPFLLGSVVEPSCMANAPHACEEGHLLSVSLYDCLVAVLEQALPSWEPLHSGEMHDII